MMTTRIRPARRGLTLIEVLVVLMLLGVVLLLTLPLVNMAWTRNTSVVGIVVSKSFVPGSTTTSSGVAVVPNGGNRGGVSVAPVFGSSHTAEKWLMVVRFDAGSGSGPEVEAVDVTKTRWAMAEPGDRVTVVVKRGRLFGGRVGVAVR